jgi:hypothetical protein
MNKQSVGGFAACVIETELCCVLCPKARCLRCAEHVRNMKYVQNLGGRRLGQSCSRFAVSSWFGHLWSSFLHPVPSRGGFHNPALELATFVSDTVTFCLRPYPHVFSHSIQHILVDCPGYSYHQRTNVSPSTNLSEILCKMLECSPSDEPLVVSTVMKLLHPTFLSDRVCILCEKNV